MTVKKQIQDEESLKDLNDVKLAMHSLRHHCDRVRKLENAVGGHPNRVRILSAFVI